ncbi:MAG: S9 family peptidase [Pirellulaceae bacterium]
MSHLRRKWLLLLLMICVSTPPLGSQEVDADRSRLTLERIFESQEFHASDVEARWLESGTAYQVLEDSGGGGKDLVQYDVVTGARTVVISAEQLIPAGRDAALSVDDYAWSQDRSLLLIYTNSQRVWRAKTRGDYWLLDRTSRQLRQLGGEARSASLMFAKISPTGRQVAYVCDRDLWVEDLHDHTIRQLTSSDSPDVINGTFDWVYEEEFSLRDGFRWSPDGQAIAYWQLDTRDVPKFLLVNNTDGLYPQVKEFAYPKVGEANPACRIGVVRLDSGETRWVDVPGDPRDNYIARMEWISSTEIVLQQLNRRQNVNHVMIADAATGGVSTLLEERDEAWVDVHDELRWLADGKSFTWISERDGWRHVYLGSRDGGELQRITAGDYDVIELLHVDEREQSLYFMASPDNPCQRYLYRIQLDGSGLTRITPADAVGTYVYRLAPDGRAAIVSSSAFDRPPTVQLVSLPAHTVFRVLEENRVVQENLQRLQRPATEFFRVDIGENVILDGWCIRPAVLEPSKKYPLLIYVYGEPAGQTVLDQWGGNNALWHWMLAQRGYVVMSFDNRGTPAPRGRKWRKCVYRRVGILGPQEQAAALRTVLADRPYLDPERAGVWGWSGGGSSALHAIFKYPELYRTAISIAPVPNQRYYDSIYQERYMGLPGDNLEGFLEGSSINYAQQLKGNLLIVHGTGDDNCHYQTVELLINELVRLDKPFSMMAYPNRTHAIREGKNTTLHLRRLMTTYLEQHLPP